MTQHLPKAVILQVEKRMRRNLDYGDGTWCGRCHHIRSRHTPECTGLVDGVKPGNRHLKQCPCAEFTMEIQYELVAKYYPYLLEDTAR